MEEEKSPIYRLNITDPITDEELLKIIRDDKYRFKFLKERIEGRLETIYPYTLSDSVIMTHTEQSLTQFIEDLIEYIDNRITKDNVSLLNYYTIEEIKTLLGYNIDDITSAKKENIDTRLTTLENGREQDVFSDPIETKIEKLTTKIPRVFLASGKTFDPKL